MSANEAMPPDWAEEFGKVDAALGGLCDLLLNYLDLPRSPKERESQQMAAQWVSTARTHLAGIGEAVAHPSRTKVLDIDEYDALVAERDQAKAELNKTKRTLDTIRGSLKAA
jgi:hypothetical protein